MKHSIIHTLIYNSPCGRLLLGSFEGRLCLCDWLTEKHHAAVKARIGKQLCATFEDGMDETLQQAICQLDEYFGRQRTSFNVPLLPIGTNFQQQVWQALSEIPYGQTWSYAREATYLGRPSAVRAVANANGANALSIFIPCHRVVGSNQKPGGYGGGMAAKLHLLRLEAEISLCKW